MDLLFYNGVIHTMDEKQNERVVEAVGVTGDKITFVGSNEEAAKLDAAEKIDLGGKLMLPGFIEGHMHLCSYAFTNNNVMLFDCKSVEDCLEAAKKFRAAHPDAKWLYCRGWNEDNFTEKRYPTREELDAICPDIPILMTRVCGHVGIVNTLAYDKVAALEEAKPLGNQMDREGGRLYEDATQLYYHILEKPSQEYVEDLMRFGMKKLNECGITTCQPDDFSSIPGADWKLIVSAYKDLEAKGEMTARIYEQSLFMRYNEYEEFLAEGYRTGMGGEYFTIGPLKLLQDGSLGAKTAALTEPYIGTTDSYGIVTIPQEDLDRYVMTAQKNGMSVAVHCIGDKAMEMVLDAIEKAQAAYPNDDIRHGIVHVQITTKKILERMAKDKVIAFIQPVFIGYDMDIVEDRVGPERTKDTYAWKTMNDLGILTVGGSDAPIESFDILENIYFAVTREKLKGGPEGGWLPDQKVSVNDAVKMFTTHGAKARFGENEYGQITEGYKADLVVLSDNIYEIEPHKIKDVKAVRTIVGGKTVYEA